MNAVYMNNTETNRAEDLIQKAARNALDRLVREHQIFSNYHYSKIRRNIEYVFDKSITNQCSKLIQAAKVKPAVHKKIEEEKKKREKARKELADELRKARAKLRTIQWSINHAEEAAKKAVGKEKEEVRKNFALRLISAKRRLKNINAEYEKKSIELSSKYTPKSKDINGYPEIPNPTDAPTERGENLPYSSGIYFLWEGERIVYVGQSKYLCNRLRLGTHHILKQHHKISFVLIDMKQLTWAECYYIGICKPLLNFGINASHHQQTI